MKLSAFIFLSLWLSLAAHAERVIVLLKDSKTSSSTPVAGQVVARLSHLKTLIVDVADEASLAKLKADPQVAYVEKDYLHPWSELASEFADDSEEASFTGATVPAAALPGRPWGVDAVKAPEAWTISKQGQGARVLILDSGIDSKHPALAANFEKGRDFTGASNGSDYSDWRGHGTHVSGIIAGVMQPQGFSGVAPKAKILMGRVCTEKGCLSSGMIAGINWGIEQKVDVINMSIAGISTTPAERDAYAKADRAGVPVVAASGNFGTDRVFYPAVLPTVIAVGAIDKDLRHPAFSQYGPELAVVGPGVDVISSVRQGTGRDRSVTLTTPDGSTKKLKASLFNGVREVPVPFTKPLADCGNGDPQDFVGRNLQGQFALITRGGDKFINKIQRAIDANAAGVIFINNEWGLLEGRFTDDGVTLPVPVFMIEQQAGPALKDLLAKGITVNATMADLVSDYGAMDGTSMATPYVTGVVALMKAANHKLNSRQVKEILKQTATPLGPNPRNEYGSGLVNAEAAVNIAQKLNR